MSTHHSLATPQPGACFGLTVGQFRRPADAAAIATASTLQRPVPPMWCHPLTASVAFDQGGVLRVERRELVPFGEFEVAKVEAWRHRAPHQRVAGVSGYGGTEPSPSCHHVLRSLTVLEAETEGLDCEPTRWVEHDDLERHAIVEMPQLVRSNPMQRRELTCRHQKVDARGEAASRREACVVSVMAGGAAIA